jgi:hypothetical protein
MQIRPLFAALGARLQRAIRNALARLVPELRELVALTAAQSAELRKLSDLILQHQGRQLRNEHPNPLNRSGRKCFSQTDEDGITLEILRRIGLNGHGTYAEFGVGNGTENNTLILAALGWKGFWVGGQDLAIDIIRTERFMFMKSWITLDNILESTAAGMSALDIESLDIVSLDLDGNDFYLVEKLLLGNIRPKLFIIEYNAKFPPPVEFCIAYDPDHKWALNDYFGASLSSFARLFTAHGFRLVCCNSLTGSNAFFIDVEYGDHFPDVPTDINQIFVEPRYALFNNYGHKRSSKVVENILGGGA